MDWTLYIWVENKSACQLPLLSEIIETSNKIKRKSISSVTMRLQLFESL